MPHSSFFLKFFKKYRVYLLIATVVLTSIFILYSSLLLYVGKTAHDDSKTISDAILVLGAKSYKGGTYNSCLVSRVTHAVDLYKAHYAPKIIMTGGNDKEDNSNEAETMKKIALDLGVNPDDILLEKSATSTYENFVLSKEILQQNGLNSVIVVTEPFHIARASLIAEKLQISYTTSPAITSSCWLKGTYFSLYSLKEPLAITLYKLQNKL